MAVEAVPFGQPPFFVVDRNACQTDRAGLMR